MSQIAEGSQEKSLDSESLRQQAVIAFVVFPSSVKFKLLKWEKSYIFKPANVATKLERR